jgi:hypothetical protein
MTKQLTLGTASVTTTADRFFMVRWMNEGSFLVGEQIFSQASAALRFVRERGLRVIECQ